jgi:membrane protein DedA with SNARE-associated domain
MLFWVGMAAGRNLDAVEAWLRDTNRGLLALALVMVAGIAWWWWRTRRAT